MSEESKKIEIVIKEAEVLKVNPQPGEVLMFKFIGDEFMQDDVNQLGKQLRQMFKNNKVVVFTLPSNHDVELTTVKEEVTIQEVKDCSAPESYCNNCNCGKKERIESGK